MRARSIVSLALCSAPLLAFGFGVLGACSTRAAPSAGLIIAVDSDLAPGKDFDRLQIEVQPPGGAKAYNQIFTEFGQPGLPVSFPTTLAIVDHAAQGGADGGADTVLVRASIGVAGGASSPVGLPLVNREALTTIPRDHVGLLRIHLEWSCIGTADVDMTGYVAGLCPEGTTCIAGACVAWSVDSSTLPVYDERAVFGGGTAAGEGTCFDTSACFAAGAIAAPDNSCTVAAPPGDTPNVAIVTHDGRGICSGGVCLVPLDQDAGDGFTIVGSRIQLPKSVCDPQTKICPGCKARPLPLGIAVTASCPSKKPSVPTCGPWSAIKRAATVNAGAPSGATSLDAGSADAATD